MPVEAAILALFPAAEVRARRRRRNLTPYPREIGEVVAAYLRWRQAQPGNATGAGRGLWTSYDILRRWLDRTPAPWAATAGQLEAWAYAPGPSGKRPAPASVINRLAVVGGFYRLARLAGRVASNPADDVPRPRRGRLVPRALSPEERVRLIAACPPTPLGLRDRALIVTALLTGLRRQELADLRVGSLSYRPDGRCYYIVRCKGGLERRRQLPRAALEAILLAWQARLGAEREELPNEWRRRPEGAREMGDLPAHWRIFGVRQDAVGWLVARRGREAGIVGCSPHRLRHSAAALRWEQGEALERVQDLLGHQDVVYTSRYLRRLAGEDDPGGEDAARALGL